MEESVESGRSRPEPEPEPVSRRRLLQIGGLLGLAAGGAAAAGAAATGATGTAGATGAAGAAELPADPTVAHGDPPTASVRTRRQQPAGPLVQVDARAGAVHHPEPVSAPGARLSPGDGEG